MRWNHFAGSVAFAAVAAALLPAVWLLAAPVVGGTTALSSYFVLVAGVYVAGLGRDGEHRATAIGWAVIGGFAVWLLCDSAAESAVGAALLVSAGRVLLFSTRPLRAVVIEAALAGGGLWLAAAIAGQGPISIAFALCAYLLVQSAYFLIGAGPSLRLPEREDGFEQARDRLLRLLDEDPA